MTQKILSQPQVVHLKEVTIAEHLSQLGLLVIHQRRIPDYYIRRECVSLGSDPSIVKTWAPTRWVTNTGRVTIDDPDTRQVAFLALQSIHQRISHHPETETYHQARTRLQKALHQLVLQGVRRARISDLTELNQKTIRSSLEYTYGQATYNAHCPWDLLDRIANTDWTPHFTTDLPEDGPPAQPITEREIQRLRHTDQQFRGAPMPQTHYVQPGDSCWHCDAPWVNFRPEPQSSPEPEITLTCRICTRVSYMQSSNTDR